MRKYTFILEYRGGTYISQITAVNLEDAVVAWVHALDASEIKYFNEEIKGNLLKEVSEDYNTPTLLDKLENVWCMFLKIGPYNSLVNVVATEQVRSS